MPEYLERRFGGRARTLYACLTIASYVLVNFALVFYTAGFALEKMWGINRIAAVWLLALVTGAYTVYGGLMAVAWTSALQCLLLLGGGIYVFFAGMAKINWDFAAVLGVGQQAHLITNADHEVPWTGMVVLMLSTNVWYYATNQYINQRCLAARNEWHAKMGVLFAVGLQLVPAAGHVLSGHDLSRPESASRQSRRRLSQRRGRRGAGRHARACGCRHLKRDHVHGVGPGEFHLHARHLGPGAALERPRLVRRKAGASGSMVWRHRLAHWRAVRARGYELAEYLPVRPGHLGADGRAGGRRFFSRPRSGTRPPSAGQWRVCGWRFSRCRSS